MWSETKIIIQPTNSVSRNQDQISKNKTIYNNNNYSYNFENIQKSSVRRSPEFRQVTTSFSNNNLNQNINNNYYNKNINKNINKSLNKSVSEIGTKTITTRKIITKSQTGILKMLHIINWYWLIG